MLKNYKHRISALELVLWGVCIAAAARVYWLFQLLEEHAH
jgi:hypothetical protein